MLGRTIVMKCAQAQKNVLATSQTLSVLICENMWLVRFVLVHPTATAEGCFDSRISSFGGILDKSGRWRSRRLKPREGITKVV